MTDQQNSSSIFQRSSCPVACTLDIIGDKWTLLVVRDLFAGKKIYSEFQNSPEKIPTNILAERLKRLTENGIVIKEPYQKHPVRYEYVLTNKGRDLGRVLKAVLQWGEKHIPGSKAMMKPLEKSG
jgi:DNA-binding HxlR family transcriptional regulator